MTLDVHNEQGSLLLIPDHPLQVLPALAVEIGLNEAIVVQQLHYWTKHSKDEEGWVYNTMEEWRQQFPFWSESTIKRTWKALRKRGLVEVQQLGGTNRTNHYRLVYECLPRYKFPTGQSDPKNGSKRPDANGQADPLSSNTETTQRTPLPPEGGPRPTKKVNRKVVTDAEYARAAEIIDGFNTAAGTKYEVDAHLTPLVGRIRERPDLGIDEHRQIIAAAFRDPWWKGHPSPAVIYGNSAQFDTSVERGRLSGGKAKPVGDRALAAITGRSA